jgi:hypothetical protein
VKRLACARFTGDPAEAAANAPRRDTASRASANRRSSALSPDAGADFFNLCLNSSIVWDGLGGTLSAPKPREPMRSQLECRFRFGQDASHERGQATAGGG